MNAIHTISGELFQQMIYSGASLLERNHELVNSLNVFPVPDGDTGSNMSLTINAAVRELKSSSARHVGELSAVAAKGALRGARGNSGVILSQLFRGMAQAFEGLEQVDVRQFAEGLQKGAEAAYKAVMKPKEGTILTVARSIAEQAVGDANHGASLPLLMSNLTKAGEATLAKTPDMLSVLKEAGVVDSGGKGLLYIYHGFQLAVDGQSIDDFSQEDAETSITMAHDNTDIMLAESTSDIRFGYCTEFFVEHLHPHVGPSEINALHDALQRIGDSVVAVADEELVKIHVHTNEPGRALQMGLRLGEINGVKIENMREQHRAIMAKRQAQRQPLGLVAVSSGKGLDVLFGDAGVDALVAGGQSMNPSALDLEKAIRSVNARAVFVLPNNKNIQLAAQQAAKLVQGEGNQDVYVLPTTSIQQGMAAVLAFDPNADAPQNQKNMEQAAKGVRSGSVTVAVRDTSVEGLKIHQGNYIGLLDEHIVVAKESLNAAFQALSQAMLDDHSEYVSIFYGEEVTPEEAQTLADEIENTYPDVDIVVSNGGQPLYPYLISVE